ncbi:quercetin dioxygenase-like cupin family protein [Maribacter caenipelagi]|uniref:Quercetin dioxygenase-like cupin family protein n=1 Tax=Maribacter caenipelagi TaxID=1447781 RepID=A0A4R7D3N4_9FLAO|nr:cupin domain-containing protein [Maribacter caenipelagi]TDS14214.1 quercetin dioxygenase-like cupin family protein [Maribacter caenipelagi]
MNRKNLLAIILMGTFIFSCKQAAEKNQTVDLNSQQELIFPIGEKVTNNNFIGDVWVHMQVMADSVNQNSVGTVTFDPGARSNWHSHPNGQIIMSLEGEGYYQEKGSEKRILRKGDVVKCPANTPHWHGASAEKSFIQIAITSRVDGPTEWLEPVPDEEYYN